MDGGSVADEKDERAGQGGGWAILLLSCLLLGLETYEQAIRRWLWWSWWAICLLVHGEEGIAEDSITAVKIGKEKQPPYYP